VPGLAWFEIDERAAGTCSERLCGVFVKICREPWLDCMGCIGLQTAVAPRYNCYEGGRDGDDNRNCFDAHAAVVMAPWSLKGGMGCWSPQAG
jgi:hypothetical protein